MEYELTVSGFSDDQVILKDKDNNIIYWPKDKLPQIPEIGQKLHFSIGTDKAGLLNELLKTDSQ
ncbi:MAG: hypothetical protein ACM3PZ_01125 [Bacillota bacterium]